MEFFNVIVYKDADLGDIILFDRIGDESNVYTVGSR